MVSASEGVEGISSLRCNTKKLWSHKDCAKEVQQAIHSSDEFQLQSTQQKCDIEAIRFGANQHLWVEIRTYLFSYKFRRFCEFGKEIKMVRNYTH